MAQVSFLQFGETGTGITFDQHTWHVLPYDKEAHERSVAKKWHAYYLQAGEELSRQSHALQKFDSVFYKRRALIGIEEPVDITDWIADDDDGHEIVSEFKVIPKQRKNKLPRHTGIAENLTRAILNIARKTHVEIEVVGKKRNQMRFKNTHGYELLHVKTQHEFKKLARTDLKTDEFLTEVLRIARHTEHVKPITKVGELKPGHSGAVLATEADQLFIVRGIAETMLVDAREHFKGDLKRIQHFSEDENEKVAISPFRHAYNLPQNPHMCALQWDETSVVQFQQMLSQAFVPQTHFQCGMCASNAAERSRSEIITDARNSHMMGALEQERGSGRWNALANIFDTLLGSSETEAGIQITQEIAKICFGNNTEPFRSIMQITQVLTDPFTCDGEKVQQAREATLQLARYLKNRELNVGANSKEIFRNPYPPISKVNYVLARGDGKITNVEWGERMQLIRAFMCKHFFWTDIDKASTFSRRKHIRGERLVAAPALQIPKTMRETRSLMEGEKVQEFPITDACKTWRNGQLVYTCCCVTHTDGAPYLTQVHFPTTNAFCIGTQGNIELIANPFANTDGKILAAKAGLCYIQIFLAMYVHIYEAQAPRFIRLIAKMVELLGEWPTMRSVATACCMIGLYFPETQSAELPEILVDHEHKTMHVVDSSGSLSHGYHVLKAGTVKQIYSFMSDEIKSELAEYNVGGQHADIAKLIPTLIRATFNKQEFIWLMSDNPYLILLAVLSPAVLRQVSDSGNLRRALCRFIHIDQPLAQILSTLDSLAAKVSRLELIDQQLECLYTSYPQMLDFVSSLVESSPEEKLIKSFLLSHIRNTIEMQRSDIQLVHDGFCTLNMEMRRKKELYYLEVVHTYFNECAYHQQLYLKLRTLRPCSYIKRCFRNLKQNFTKETCSSCITTPLGWGTTGLWYVKSCVTGTISKGRKTAINLVRKAAIKGITFVTPEIGKMLGMLSAISILLTIANSAHRMICRKRLEARRLALEKEDLLLDIIAKEMVDYCTVHKLLYTKELDYTQFVDWLEKKHAEAGKLAHRLFLEEVEHQAKDTNHIWTEKCIATFVLVMMMFDTDRSDKLYSTLNKLKGVFSTIGQDAVYHQSLDDIMDTDAAKNATIDFIREEEMEPKKPILSQTFEQFWDTQITQNRTIPHYRTVGTLLEMTRETALDTVNTITKAAIGSEFIVRGGVGTGKSTYLPSLISERGRILILEPTRPLTENVAEQLRGEPHYKSPTVMMRGLSVFGSSPITVMTSGFALHFYANNRTMLKEFSYIMIDECHVMDADAMTFYSLCKDIGITAKILKVSATPPGRECDAKPIFPVKMTICEQLTFEGFVSAQGTGSANDATALGHDILVYVASYNEVDRLSSLLTNKGFAVTKVDGRTMKLHNGPIPMIGHSGKKHFIVATNIIENGVTLAVDYLVDFGTKVVAELDMDGRRIAYSKCPISFGERIQRIGRVGRIKPGGALRIGETKKGIPEIPESIATTAAFNCFLYDLPVMTGQVSLNVLSRCTREQARTMAAFEISPFAMAPLTAYDGSMHPAVHSVLKRYKLRESEIKLKRSSLPLRSSSSWFTVREYETFAGTILIDNKDVKIPFLINNIPHKVFEELWTAIMNNKSDVTTMSISTIQSQKIAYTLQTDSTSLQRTITTIDMLIAEEQRKKQMFAAYTANSSGGFMVSLSAIAQCLKSRWARDFCDHNLHTLIETRNQLCEFENLAVERYTEDIIRNYPCVTLVEHQNRDEMIQKLQLKAKYDNRLIATDLALTAGTLIGGGVMLYKYVMNAVDEQVTFEGDSKRARQKLQFKQGRANKEYNEVYADEDTVRENFGEAYTKKGRKGANFTKGAGKKTHEFTHFYGVDPTQYELVRYIDPLTGYTIDVNAQQAVNARSLEQAFIDERENLHEESLLAPGATFIPSDLQAYFINTQTRRALRVDLEPHNPMRVGHRTNNIAGFPDREGEFRQSRPARPVNISQIPDKKDSCVAHESKSHLCGVRDYTFVSKVICSLEYYFDDMVRCLYGICYDTFIIANAHLIPKPNGWLKIKTKHGIFTVQNMQKLKIKEIRGTDLIVITCPKDMQPAPCRLKFRAPRKGEKVVMISTTSNDSSGVPMVSEASVTTHKPNTNFWIHWISTKRGHCGLPIVSLDDQCILGLHSLGSVHVKDNYYAIFGDNFVSENLLNTSPGDWMSKWSYNPDNIDWGTMDLKMSKPGGSFKTTKDITDIDTDVEHQHNQYTWLTKYIGGNLAAVAKCPGNLITKHVVKGRSPTFSLYLSVDEEANAFFQPLLSHYSPSRLNKEAFVKDVTKYDKLISVGDVDIECFVQSVQSVFNLLSRLGFQECAYITDAEEIFASLNMKAAVGALYGGKKETYFSEFSNEDKQQILKESYGRLYEGKFGVWNGSLKAELRPNAKVEANKTRVFTAAPLDTLLAAKGCVDDFNNQFYSKHLEGPWTVGITKFKGRWNDFLRLLPDGWIYCDADGSQFDSSLTPYLINAVLNIRLQFMQEWSIGKICLENLYTEIVYTAIATPDGSVIKKFRGNNSGQPSTVVDNTLMVVLAMQYAIAKHGLSPESTDSFIRYFANGDDLVIAIAPEKVDLLDTLAQSFGELGLNYDFSSRVEKREDLWFMSHQGKLINDMYIPMLERERVVAILEWDRSHEPEFQMDAINAAIIESWGDDELIYQVRKYYNWLLEQEPYKSLADAGKAPYLAETALTKLYTDVDASQEILDLYKNYVIELPQFDEPTLVYHEADDQQSSQNNPSGEDNKTNPQTGDGQQTPAADQQQNRANTENTENQQNAANQQQNRTTENAQKAANDDKSKQLAKAQSKEVVRQNNEKRVMNSGGDDADVTIKDEAKTFVIPKVEVLNKKLRMPKFKGKAMVNVDHLLVYKPDQRDLSNKRATQRQVDNWVEKVAKDYGVEESSMDIIINGFMVWALDNGTSPNITGTWIMMDKEEQREYPIEPLVRHAQPTLRQIMMHLSDTATGYIVLRNTKERYMPGYGLKRNLNDMSLAPYAFDFYEITSETPNRVREAHLQMKAAAIRGKVNRTFGLDGTVSSGSEDTERHTVDDVKHGTHSFYGAGMN
nr:polyprotein [Agropyron mosaic virus]